MMGHVIAGIEEGLSPVTLSYRRPKGEALVTHWRSQQVLDHSYSIWGQEGDTSRSEVNNSKTYGAKSEYDI